MPLSGPQIDILRAEIFNDPLTIGYGGFTPQQVLDSLKTANRQRNKTSLSGDEVYNSANAAEVNGKTDAQRNQFLTLCARDSLDPFGAANVGLITEIFSAGSSTVASLQALRVETITRAEELGIGGVRYGDIKTALTLGAPA